MTTSAMAAAMTAKKPVKKYLLPTANACILLPSCKRITAPDGIITADSFELEQYMEDMLLAGNCTRFEEGDKVTKAQTIPVLPTE